MVDFAITSARPVLWAGGVEVLEEEKKLGGRCGRTLEENDFCRNPK